MRARKLEGGPVERWIRAGRCSRLSSVRRVLVTRRKQFDIVCALSARRGRAVAKVGGAGRQEQRSDLACEYAAPHPPQMWADKTSAKLRELVAEQSSLPRCARPRFLTSLAARASRPYVPRAVPLLM